MQPLLFDTSIYITALHGVDGAAVSLRRLGGRCADMAEFGCAGGVVRWHWSKESPCGRGSRARFWSSEADLGSKPNGLDLDSTQEEG